MNAITWKVSIVIVYELRSGSPKYMRPKVGINPSGNDSFISRPLLLGKVYPYKIFNIVKNIMEKKHTAHDATRLEPHSS